jgi:hypothetical protein
LDGSENVQYYMYICVCLKLGEECGGVVTPGMDVVDGIVSPVIYNPKPRE